jgi:molybdopterin synthase sulfur carrier subunit
MKTKVLLFGMLAQEANQSLIDIENAHDTDTLIKKINELYPGFRNYNFVIAKNKKIIKSNQSLMESDMIALLPPFSGG